MVRQVLIKVDTQNSNTATASSSFMVDVDGYGENNGSSSLTLQDLLDKLPKNVLRKAQHHEVSVLELVFFFCACEEDAHAYIHRERGRERGEIFVVSVAWFVTQKHVFMFVFAFLVSVPFFLRFASLSPQVFATHKGRVLGARSSLVGSGLAMGDVLHVRTAKLCGGGGDGGSTGAEDRRAWLEMFLEKKPDKVDPREVKKAKWTRCQISGQKLCPPCVTDALGNLYNKEALLNALLTKSIPPECSYIRGLKDVTAIKLVRNDVLTMSGQGMTPATSQEGGKSKDKSKVRLDGDVDDVANEFEFQCPITGLEMNGRFRFYAVLPSGHVVSQRAVKEAKECVEELVGGKGQIAELLPINGTDEEVKALREKVEAARRRKLQKKLEKKRKKEQKEKQTKATERTIPAASESKEKRSREGEDEKEDELKRPRSVYESLFTSSQKDGEASSKETFLCRSTSARGMSLT